MKAKPFTEAEDNKIRELRNSGRNWPQVALALGRSRSSIYERSKDLGLVGRALAGKATTLSPGQELVPPVANVRPGREPLPAGHSLSWDLITQGTQLAGASYEDAKDAKHAT